MKRIILAAALAASSVAQAQSVMYLPNTAGGRIVLNANTCYHNGQRIDALLAAWTHTREGRVIQGCWMYDKPNELIHVVWADGERRVYDVNRFTVLKP